MDSKDITSSIENIESFPVTMDLNVGENQSIVEASSDESSKVIESKMTEREAEECIDGADNSKFFENTLRMDSKDDITSSIENIESFPVTMDLNVGENQSIVEASSDESSKVIESKMTEREAEECIDGADNSKFFENTLRMDSKDDITSSIENIESFPVTMDLNVGENQSIVEASSDESSKVIESKMTEREAEECIDGADNSKFFENTLRMDSKDDITSSIENIESFPVTMDLNVGENQSIVEASSDESSKVIESKMTEREAEECIDGADNSKFFENTLRMDSKDDITSSIENIESFPVTMDLNVGENQSIVEASSDESSKVIESKMTEREAEECIDGADNSKFFENVNVGENQSVVEASSDESSKVMKSKITEKDAEECIDEDIKSSENSYSVDRKCKATDTSEEVQPKLSTASQKKETTGKDLMKERLSLPYFSLPKPSYLEYTNQVAKNLKTPSLCTKSSNNIRRNDELAPAILEEVVKETNEKIYASERSSSVHPDIKEMVKPNNCQDEEMARFKSSPDDKIVIIDVPSPHGRLQRFKERCLHATASKSAKKPNINFSSEISVKKPVGILFERTQIESTSDGVMRGVWRSQLLEDIKKKKENAFNKSKEIEHIDNEDFEEIEHIDNEDFEAIEEENEDFEAIEEENEDFEAVEEENEDFEAVEEKNEDFEAIEEKNEDFEAIEEKSEDFEAIEEKSEDFEAIEDKNEDFEAIEEKNEDFEANEEKNEDFEVIEGEIEVIRHKNEDFEAIEMNDNNDMADLNSEISEDEGNLESSSSDEYADDEESDTYDNDYFEKYRHISVESMFDQQLNATEETFTEFSNCTIIGDNIFDSTVCFSLPSYQPDGGFAKPSEQEMPDTDASLPHSHLNTVSIVENSVRSLSTPYEVITLSSDSDHYENIVSSVDWSYIPLSSIPFMPSASAVFNNTDTFEDDSVSQICSGAFPSTNYLPSTSSQSCFSSKIIVNKSAEDISPHEKIVDRSFDASCRDFEEASPCLSVKKRRVILETSEDEEDNCKKSDTTDSSFAIAKRQKISAESLLKESNPSKFSPECIEFELSNNEVDNSKPVIQDKDPAVEKNKIVKSFIEDEAELSGEEQSSDEDERGLDAVENDENHEDVPDNETLRDQIGQMHLKHMQDDDDRVLNVIMNDFVDEGELHAESGQRKKKFSWANKDLESEATGIANSSDSDGDNVEIFDPLEHQDKLKWMKEVSAENIPNEPSEAISTKNVNLKMEIIGKSNVSVSDKKIDGSLKRKRGSLINSEGLKVKRIKKEAATGGRKQVFFVKNDQENPVPSTSTEHKKKEADSVPFKK